MSARVVQLAPVAPEIFLDVAAVLEAVHDVVEHSGMRKPQRMPDSCRQVRYTMASRSSRSPFTGSGDGPHINLRAQLPFKSHRPRLAVHALLGGGPVQTNARVLPILHAREFEFPAGRLLPGLESPLGQLRIVGLAQRRRIGARLRPSRCISLGRRDQNRRAETDKPQERRSCDHRRSARRSSASILTCASSCSMRLVRSSINWPSGSGRVPCSR